MKSIKYTDGRIICKVDLEQKNKYSFSNGTTIELIRDVNNFDRKYTQQVLGVVVSGENIPTDALVLFHHNSLHETYEIFNHSQLSGEEIKSGIKLFSIMERDCFFWKFQDEKEWHPTKSFATALRVFKPYTGIMKGIEPTKLKNILYVTSGSYKGIAVMTVDAADYEVVFRDPLTGKDNHIIRFRPDGNEDEQRQPEVSAIMNEITEKINKGELLIGLTPNDAKQLKSESTESLHI